MNDGHSRIPSQEGIQVMIDDPAWRRLVRNADSVAKRAAASAGARATILLTSDRAVKRLNTRHRGIAKPTNVLTFDPAFPGAPGEIVLARETIAREAQSQSKTPANHLAHLVIHAALHLAGHDHHHPGEAIRMERTETRLMRALRRPDPWSGDRTNPRNSPTRAPLP